MRRLIIFAFLLLALPLCAQSVTPTLDLTLPNPHAQNWGFTVNNNFLILDTTYPTSNCGDAAHAVSWNFTTKRLGCQAIVAGSPSFSLITAGTNTAALLVGTGGSLGISGSGTINSTTLLGSTWAVPGAIGATTPSTGAFTLLDITGITGMVQCLHVNSAGLISGTGADCGSGGGGGVSSVSGTSGQITVVNGSTTPTVSVPATFTFPGTVTNPLSIFGPTTSTQFLGVISDATGNGKVMGNVGPTITAPIIADFTSATHNHQNATGGGTLSVSALNATGTPSSATFLRGDNTWSGLTATFGGITSGTNTTAAMVLGTGSSLTQAGTGLLNGMVTSNATTTVQQSMTAASTNGISTTPTISAATDIPNGTRLNSRDRPTLSAQSNGLQNVDYRYGGRVTSYFNPGHDASGLNIWYGPGEICNWNQPFGNVSNGGTNNGTCQIFQSNFLSGGQNINGNGYTNKTDLSSVLSITNSWTPGESEGIRQYSNCYSNGDCTAGFFTALHYGTTNGGSDEGLEGPDLDISQGTAEYTGAVSGNPALGATSVTITPTLALALRTQGEGREIFDSTQGTTTGTVTSLTGSGLVAVVGSSTGWTTSTATTTSAAISVTGSNNSPGSVNVLVASSAGFANGNVACISDGSVWEQTLVSAVPDGTHITATFTLPYASGATIATGGLCGWGLELDEDRWTTAGHFGFVTVTPPLHQIWPIIKSTSATALTILIQTAGAADGYAGQATLPGAAYHIYPMTQLTSVINGGGAVSDTLTLSPNTIDFASGDTIYVAIGPTLKHQGVGNWQLNTWFASQPLGNYQSGPVHNGIVSANDYGWQVTNNTTLTKYAGHGGKLIVPNTFVLLQGLYNYGIKFNLAPDRTAMYIPCPLNSSGVASCAGNPLVHVVDWVNGHGGSDYIAYNPTSGAEYIRFNFQNGGHSCQFGQNANGISCDGHLRSGQNAFSGGVLDLMGLTSGTATLTAPAVAVTTTNPVVSSNALQAPVLMLSANVTWSAGAGVPSAGTCTTAQGGSIYSRTDGTTTTSLYVCDNATGVWTAK